MSAASAAPVVRCVVQMKSEIALVKFRFAAIAAGVTSDTCSVVAFLIGQRRAIEALVSRFSSEITSAVFETPADADVTVQTEKD